MPQFCRCAFICNRFEKPSNETLLCVAFLSFMGFASVQTVVALIARSEAMMGDSAAMAVDALTYGFNLYAERKKNEEDEQTNPVLEDSEIELSVASTGEKTDTNTTTTNDAERVQLERQFGRRRRRLHLEIVPPVLSVSILIIVISFVLRNSIHTLLLAANRSENDQTQSEPNLKIMMTFSSLNLGLDLVNVSCFARAQHLMGFNMEDNKEGKEVQEYDVIDNSDGLIGGNMVQYERHGAEQGGDLSDEEDDEELPNGITTNEPIQTEENDEDERVNLNMCSAYTHVFADTLRSISVIIASVIGVMVESITPEVADSTAAVIVSVIILGSVLPLLRGILRTVQELRSITLEEKALSASETNNIEGEIS